jgi:hypothetical protein
MSRVKQPEPEPGPLKIVPEPGPIPPPSPSPLPVHRVRARDVPALVEKICETADANPDAEFEITWRIVDS